MSLFQVSIHFCFSAFVVKLDAESKADHFFIDMRTSISTGGVAGIAVLVGQCSGVSLFVFL